MLFWRCELPEKKIYHNPMADNENTRTLQEFSFGFLGFISRQCASIGGFLFVFECFMRFGKVFAFPNRLF